MSQVEEIEQAIQALPPADFRRIAEWIHRKDHWLWDEEMDRDCSSGRLDALFAEADHEKRDDQLVAWPSQD